MTSCDGQCDSKQSLNILCLGKYLCKSLETLKTEIKTLRKRSLKKWVAIAMMSVPDPFNEYHKMKHNSAITCQNQIEFWDQNAKQGFS